MSTVQLPRRDRAWFDQRVDPINPEALADAQRIMADIRAGGIDSLRAVAASFGEIAGDEPLLIPKPELDAARDRIAADDQAVLERVAERIARFAQAQLDSLQAFEMPVPGGIARQVVQPVDAAGCYAPGGRYPLPSSVLMTAVTARIAGVARIIVASPKPTDITLAAASIAGADALLRIGGAQAIVALADGIGLDAVDVIAGPGNAWVTAAKYLVSDRVRIDMLAGPSELVVVADDSADPKLVAADLLAQAEHDTLARPILIATDETIIAAVEIAISEQLETLPTRAVAAASITQHGGAIVASDPADIAALCNQIAPEHLQLSVADPQSLVPSLRHYGGLFIGEQSAEVLGDYGAGPNHTLPTGGTARYKGGLSVFDFIKVQTQLEVTDAGASADLVADAAHLARLEGLAGHERAATMRGG